MSDITMHFGQFILCALSLLGAACYGVIALIAMCVSLAAVSAKPREQWRQWLD